MAMKSSPSLRSLVAISLLCFVLFVLGGGLIWKGIAEGPGVYIIFSIIFLIYVALRLEADVWPAVQRLRAPMTVSEGVVVSKEATSEGYRLRFDFSTEEFTVERETSDAVAAGDRVKVVYRPGTGRVEELLPCPGEEPGPTSSGSHPEAT